METDEESEEEGRSGEESELEGPRREHRDPVVDRQNMATVLRQLTVRPYVLLQLLYFLLNLPGAINVVRHFVG